MAIEGNLLSSTTETIDPNTSGWRPRANCSLSLGSGGRVGGDGVLTMSATAAGEMQAETVSSYPVAPGQVYYTFADSASGTQPERIGIEWLDDTGTTVGTVLWSLTTAEADASWHRISVAGKCPPDAARARVLLSAVAAAAGDEEYAENVYLGLPKRTEGNLLSFNAESGGEVDLSAWAAVTNCTLARMVPAFGWSVDYYRAGGHVVAASATADGDLVLQCVERPQINAGTDYLAYLYLSPPTATADTWVELRFYDADGAQLQATRAYLDQSGTGLYRQRCSAIAPPGAVTAGLFAGMDAATAGQELRVEGALIAYAAQVPSGSVMPYADASFEQGPAGWSISSGPATLARSSPWGSVGLDGSYALSVTSATVGTSVLVSARYPVAPGGNWRSQIALAPDAGAWRIDAALRWYDADGVEISLSGNTGLVDLPGTGTWWNLTFDATPPAGAVTARCEWTLDATAADSVMLADSAMLRAVLPLSDLQANNDTASVTITLRELDVGELATLWRIGPDGDRTLVRGAGGLIKGVPVDTDLWVIEDYEVPLGQPVTYLASYVLTDGTAAGFTRADVPVTLDPGDRNYAWLKDPGNPQRNMRLLIERAPDWTRPIAQTEYRVRGRRNSVVLSDVRGGLEGTLTLWTRDDDERARMHWLLGSGNVLLWQAAPGMGISDLYVNVGEAVEARLTDEADDPWRAWQLPLKQADTPDTVGVNGSAGRTWHDVLLEFDTWGDVLDAYATWEDVLLNRRREVG